VTSRLSLPKISTIPSIARNENVPDGSSGNVFSTTSSSTSPAGSGLATSEPTNAKAMMSEVLFITQRHHRVDIHGAASWRPYLKLRNHVYSARNATTGSTRPARRAGNQHAIPAARQSTIAPKNHANMLGVGRPDH